MRIEKNTIHDRKVQAYLKPKTYTMFEGYVAKHQVSESTAINMICKEYFSALPEPHRSELMAEAKKSNSQNRSEI